MSPVANAPASSGASPDRLARTRIPLVTAVVVTLIGSASVPAVHSSSASAAELHTSASDSFERTVSAGFGSSEVGGAWTPDGSADPLSVSGGAGRIRLTKPGSGTAAFLSEVTAADSDVRATVSVAKATGGNGTYVSLVSRRFADGGSYRLKLRFREDGAVVPSLVHTTTGDAKTLGTGPVVSDDGSHAGALQVRLQTSGSTDVHLRAKVWTAGTDEPTSWQLVATDTAGAAEASGTPGISAYLSSGATTASEVSVDDVSVAPLPAATIAPPAVQAPASVPTSKPDGGNTGVPSGTTLRRFDGDLRITTPGAVIDGLDVHGFLSIAAPDVTVRRSIIRGGWTSTNRALVGSTQQGVVIEDSELVPEYPSVHIDGLKGFGFTARRLEIHGTVDSVLVWGDNTVVERSWLHGNHHYDSDPNQGGSPSHDDGVQMQGGRYVSLRDNTIEGAYNAAVMVTQDVTNTQDLKISGNWLDGGGCTVNISEKGRGPLPGLVLNDNVFGTNSRLHCAVIMPATTPLSAWHNVYADTGAAIEIKKN